MHLCQAALDTPLDSPLSATLSVHGLHFTVCAPSAIFGQVLADVSPIFAMFSSCLADFSRFLANLSQGNAGVSYLVSPNRSN